MSQAPPPLYSDTEELVNCLTHGLGVLLAAVGLAVLAVSAVQHGSSVDVVSSFVFGLTLLNLFASSTLYHAIQNPEAKRVLRRLDHAAIFLLIAGTYTPFTLVTLRGIWGWSLFAVVWGLAVAGLFFEGALRRRWVGLSLGLYLLMGWVAVAAIKPLLESLPRGGVGLLVAGGLAYTIGTIFYLVRRIPFNHALWHLAVLAGSVLHYFAVLLYVIPRG